VTKEWIWKMQMDALESRQIDSDACRLFLILCKRYHRNICSNFPEPFELSLAQASHLIGYSTTTKTDTIKQLLSAGYLVKRGVTGCPPTNRYMVVNWGSTAPIERGSTAPINRGEETPINRGAHAPNHISSSFQEGIESNGSNSRNGGINGSLRSKGTNGESMAAPPAALKKGTDEERKRVAENLAAFRSSLKRPLAGALPRRADDDAGRKQAFKKGKK